MRNQSALIALLAAVLLGAGGYWWTTHEPPSSSRYAGLALTPAVNPVGAAGGTGGNLAGQLGQRRAGNYGYPGSLSYRGSLADRLPRSTSPLIREVRPLNGGSVFGYVLPDGGGGFLLQFICDGTGPVYITSTDPTGNTYTTALECADATTARSFRYVGPSALRITSRYRSDGRIAVQVVRLGR